jgi:Flp pilus assembly protein TadG
MKNILSKLKDEKGQSAVEFALVAIFLLLLVFGIIEFGRAWYRADILKTAANVAARACTVSKVTADAVTAGQNAIHNYNSAIDSVNFFSNNICETTAPMSAVTVTVTETFKSSVPVMFPMLNNITLTRTATYSMGP